jgi:hypothetical protein
MGATYTFGNSTSNLATASAQTKYNNTNLAAPVVVLRVKGDAWTNLATFQEHRLFRLPNRQNFNLRASQDSAGVYSLVFSDSNNGNSFLTLTFTPSASAFYVIYAQYEIGGSGCYVVIADASGTVLTASSKFYDSALGGTTGEIEFGPSDVAKGYTLDGAAIYTAPKSGAARFAVPTSGDSNIVGLYKFDEGSGTSVADATGGTSLTIAGSGTWNTNDGAWDGSTSLFRPYFITG